MIDSHIIGNAGLYYCSYRLSLLGWNAMPTSRNAKGIDVLAYNTKASKIIGIQVKSLSKRAPVPLGKSIENVIGDFWVIVNNLAENPRFYILLPEEIKSLAHRGEKDSRISYWLQPREYEKSGYLEAWSRIGFGHATL